MYLFDEITTQVSSPAPNPNAIMIMNIREPVQHELHMIIENHMNNDTISLRNDVVKNLLFMLNERKKLH